jgi:hypothetical protein
MARCLHYFIHEYPKEYPIVYMGSGALAQNNAKGALLSILQESGDYKQRMDIFEKEGD